MAELLDLPGNTAQFIVLQAAVDIQHRAIGIQIAVIVVGKLITQLHHSAIFVNLLIEIPIQRATIVAEMQILGNNGQGVIGALFKRRDDVIVTGRFQLALENTKFKLLAAPHPLVELTGLFRPVLRNLHMVFLVVYR